MEKNKREYVVALVGKLINNTPFTTDSQFTVQLQYDLEKLPKRALSNMIFLLDTYHTQKM